MIELKNISRTFRLGSEPVHALSQIDLTIRDGEYLSVMGPSGSGKSTLLNVIGLLDRADEGRYLLDGVDVTSLDESQRAQVRREKIGFVFQAFHLVPRLTAAENVALPLMLAGIPAAQRSQRVQRVLEEFGLAKRAHHKPDQLSGGERQRVAIARAVVMRPTVILADEPTGNLDQHNGHEVIALLERLHESGVALVVVTHDPAIGSRAHRQIKMTDGKIVAEVFHPEEAVEVA